MAEGRGVTEYLPWRVAMADALYGPGGFYRDPAGPGAHFRTSVHVSPLFAEALARLAARHRLTTVVDVGAGRGELVRALHALDAGLGLVAVELTVRPADLPAAIEWRAEPPTHAGAGVPVLAVANEWLDNVPLDVVAVADDGTPRRVIVHPKTGEEMLGPVREPAVLDWLARGWPLPATPGYRAEIGRSRDEAWTSLVRGLAPGSVVLAIDYGHELPSRPAFGSLTGYRRGRQVPPIPDGSCDLTAHVALDALAAAARAAGAEPVRLTTQRVALALLGISAARPDLATAGTDPRGYLAELSRAGEAAELLDQDGLGGFGWLTAQVPIATPPGP